MIKDTTKLRIGQEVARQRSVWQGFGVCQKVMAKRTVSLWLIALILHGVGPGIYSSASTIRAEK